jgi:hypothetical protein
MFLVTPAVAQEKQPGDQSSGAKGAPQAEKKPKLLNATRVSTDAAARAAAQDATKKAAQNKTADNIEDTGVVEFRAADNEFTSSSTGVVTQKTAQKGILKNIHGSAYGAMDAKNHGTNAEGGAVGASSKSGKSAIYVETNRAVTSHPR